MPNWSIWSISAGDIEMGSDEGKSRELYSMYNIELLVS